MGTFYVPAISSKRFLDIGFQRVGTDVTGGLGI